MKFYCFGQRSNHCGLKAKILLKIDLQHIVIQSTLEANLQSRCWAADHIGDLLVDPVEEVLHLVGAGAGQAHGTLPR